MTSPRRDTASVRRARLIRVALWSPLFLAIVVLASTFVKLPPAGSFYVERRGARMPVWVKGRTDSGTFVVFIHGGPGSSGTLESILEVSPADGRLGHPSPFRDLEPEVAVVYWGQRHSGMSGGPADPDDSTPEDFGEDLRAVMREIRTRHEVRSLFLVGQSWGHAVAMSALTFVPGWRETQAATTGYVAYKGNHEQELAYRIARTRLTELGRGRVAAADDAAFWQDALAFYGRTPELRTLTDAGTHSEVVERAMGSSLRPRDRIVSSFRASLFSPFNGWTYYLNHRRTVRAERFMSWVLTSTALRDTLPRLSIPALLVYGGRDLVAPPEVGAAILDAIATPPEDKSLVVLPESRHGAEGRDVPRLLDALRAFIRRYAPGGVRPAPPRPAEPAGL